MFNNIVLIVIGIAVIVLLYFVSSPFPYGYRPWYPGHVWDCLTSFSCDFERFPRK